MDDVIVRHGVSAPGAEPIDHLVVGPAGAYAVGAARLPRPVERAQIRWMREALAGRGLGAFPGVGCAARAAAVTAASADRRFAAVTVERAVTALAPAADAPPPFVADLA